MPGTFKSPKRRLICLMIEFIFLAACSSANAGREPPHNQIGVQRNYHKYTVHIMDDVFWEHSKALITNFAPGLSASLPQATQTTSHGVREGSTMAEHRETYKGREIVVRPRTQEADAGRAATQPAESELIIDGQPLFTVRNSSGEYIATGFAFAPQSSLVELGKRVIDYRDASK